MSSALGALRRNVRYAFLLMGVVWLAIAAYVGSLLLLWPVVALLVGGALLMTRPGWRLTWAWVISAAFLGMLLSLYQAYVAASLVTGAFATVAGGSLALFALLFVVHIVLAYFGATTTTGPPR